MTNDSANSADLRDVERGRLLNDLFDAGRRGELVQAVHLRASDSTTERELRECAGMLRDLGLATGRLDALIAHGIFEKSKDRRFPARLGLYDVIEYIGRGGMGLVFKAYDKTLRRTIALKLLRPELCHDVRTVERFAREARAAAALNHPNIVTIHSVGEHAGVHYMAMEYVAGPSLAEAIKSCQLAAVSDQPCGTGFKPVESAIDLHNAETIREIFHQLLEALAAAHEAGLIHRDIKSSNILLGLDSTKASPPETAVAQEPESRILKHEFGFHVKLADFGLARMANSQTHMTAADSVLGTPEYMSPEQARGESDLDHRADLYSAGVVLYEMLTGRTPFKADTPTGVIQQILNIEPRVPGEINPTADPVLASVALRLMAKEREGRLTSAREALSILAGKRRVSSASLSAGLKPYLKYVGGVFLVCLCAWVVPHSFFTEKRIADIRVAPNNDRCIQAVYEGEADWRTIRNFPIALTEQGDRKTLAVAGDPYGRQTLVAAFPNELEAGTGEVLSGFTARGKERWRLALHSPLHWPDCAPPASSWCASIVETADLDGDSGDEILVVAHDIGECPTRLAIVDPLSGRIRSSFWHFGHIMRMRVLPGYFPDGRPAILAWAYNNKLDGFEDGLRDEEKQYANWDVTMSVMILDPDHMDGLGPPFTRRIPELRPITPVAYGFLNRPYATTIKHVLSDPRMKEPVATASPELIWLIVDVRLWKPGNADGSGPWFSMIVRGRVGKDAVMKEGVILLDRNLDLVPGGMPNNSGSSLESEERYQQAIANWRVIIRNGEYVE